MQLGSGLLSGRQKQKARRVKQAERVLAPPPPLNGLHRVDEAQ